MQRIYQESEALELKEKYVLDIRKEILAFANTIGGTVLIGIRDDGAVLGVEDADFVIQQITNSLRDSVKPDISLFLNYQAIEIEGKQIVEVKVQRGTNRPYYLAAKGLRPEGVYVRQGTSSVPASDLAIRTMIKETDGDIYENMRSLKQELTFDYACHFFKERKLELGYLQMCSLKLIVEDTIYTNLALLLSDQCPHIIKAAKFNGTDQREFQDRCEFEGSLLKQLDEAYAYLLKYNKLAASFEGLFRIDTKDYPEMALREGLLNAIVHRDYSLLAPTLISIYDDRIEMVSVGGVVGGVDFKALQDGLSICRNPQLANIFYRLRLIEAYGTGIPRINSSYELPDKKPRFVITPSSFRLVLKNNNYRVIQGENIKGNSYGLEVNEKVEKFGNKDREQKVMELVVKQGYVVRNEIEGLLGISMPTAARLLNKMVMENRLAAQGNGRQRRYVLAK